MLGLQREPGRMLPVEERDKLHEQMYAGRAGMKQCSRTTKTAEALRWARRLSARVESILATHPEADPDNIRHTLILLEQPPLERLQRSLIRGRAAAIFRK